MIPTVTLTEDPHPDLRGIIGAGLDRHNFDAAGYADSTPLAIALSDPETGAALGGISGRTSLGMLFIDLVYIPHEFRGQDLGTRMLAMAEAEAIRRGCRSAFLFTISFQAPGFYEKHGWTRFGEIPCDPPGTSRVFFRKALA